jgi:hypothetical protein
MSVEWVPSPPVTVPRTQRLEAVPRGRPVKTGPPPAVESLAHRVRAEYLEMPGLDLTIAQAVCLWATDTDLCERVMSYLVDAGFLVRTERGTFIRAESR